MSKLIRLLSLNTGLRDDDIDRIIRRAPDTYKSYPIPKRNGNGNRIISQPAREVKALQRILMRRLHGLEIHDAAMAYRKGISIRTNALRHAQNGPILKYDFESFFPSIKGDDWKQYCLLNSIFSDPQDVERSASLFFHRANPSNVLRLAIGAPSSPWISNVLMHDFDDVVTREVAKDRVVYTRYADDLTFSAPRTGYLTVVDGVVRDAVRNCLFPRLKLNEAKTTTATKKFRRVVTGLVLADDGSVSIGRDNKRLIRARVHRALSENVGWDIAKRILGYISHIRSVEPSYYDRLIVHYGKDFEERIRTTNQISEGEI